VQSHDFNGFPVVQGEMFLGFVAREKLRLALGLSYLTRPCLLALTVCVEQLLSERSPGELAKECTFSRTGATSEPDLIDLSSLLEVSVLELRTEVPLELVVNTIHKMVRASLLPIIPSLLNKTYDSELTANPFHATGEAYGFDNQVRYCRFIDCTPAA